MNYLQNIFFLFNLLLIIILQSILKKKQIFFLFIFSFLLFPSEILGQDLILKISTFKEKNNIVITKINYQQKHLNITKLNTELSRIKKKLKNFGYYSLGVEKKIVYKDTVFVKLNLGKKIETILISVDSINIVLLKKFSPKKGILKLPVENLELNLSKISKELGYQGFSFSEVSLKNIRLKNNTLLAELNIIKSYRRKINDIVIRGYDNFPKTYLKNFLKINNQTIFNTEKLNAISKKLSSLSFIKQTKQIETLFKKDSTILYLYLKKKNNSSFDGLINFNTNQAGKIQFNGYLDLKINNTFNRGEELALHWNRFDKERQELKLSSKIPFIYNSPISSSLDFSIYKQDSSFINTRLKTNFNIYLNQRTKLAIDYDLITSEITNNELNTENKDDFSSQFVGVILEYNIPLNDFFSSQKINLLINPRFGKRKSSSNSTKQFKIDLHASYIFNLNNRSSLFLANTTGYINSDTFLFNELYRIGGANSVRGFNEQSLFTSKFSYFNLEYRFLTSKKSFAYTISDYGEFKDLNRSNKIYSIGAGYKFITNNSQIDINYALGKINNDRLDYKNPKIIISLISFF